MSIIDEGTLDEARRMDESGMPDSVTLERDAAREQDEGGGFGPVSSAPTKLVTIGRISSPALALEGVALGQMMQDGTERLAVPVATDVRGSDRVVVTSARYATVTRYSIVQVVPLSSYSTHRALIVKPAFPAGA